MTWLPEPVVRLLETALVSELCVIGRNGEPITHPLIPLWDGQHIFMTSSVLFSKKLEHIKRNPKVSVSISYTDEGVACAIQGDARVIEDDPHETWEMALPLWRAKEPAIDTYLGKRFALPLFFERSVIEITPRRVAWWPDGDPERPPQVTEAPVEAG